MVLVDTSVWVDYLRGGDPELASLLQAGQVCSHDFVVGELACGTLRNRVQILGLVQSLQRLPTAAREETLFLIENRSLMGRGIGYIDVHLLASTIIEGARLWTKDKCLKAIAQEARCAHPAQGA